MRESMYQDILHEGQAQGLEQKAQEIATNMLNEGVAKLKEFCGAILCANL